MGAGQQVMTLELDLNPTASLIEIPNPSGDGLEQTRMIPARTWGNAQDCIAGALLVHGLGAHSGWFEACGRQLKERRIFALSYDQVGFGKRRQEKFLGPEQWYGDLVTSFGYLQNVLGKKPIYVMGNSMGAAVALKVIGDSRVQPRGFIMFSPGFDGHPQTFTLGYRLGAITQALLHPNDEITLPYTVAMVTGTQSIRTYISCDPDRRFEPTGRMLLGVLKLSIALKRIAAVSCPIFLFSAGIDRIVDVKLGLKTYQRLKAPSKQQSHFPEAWHDLMFDPALEEVCKEIADWIASTANLQAETQG